MSEILRYRFQPGETVQMCLSVGQITELVGFEPVHEMMRLEGRLVVVERFDDKSVRIEMEGHVVEQPEFTPPIPDSRGFYRLSHRGELLAADPVAPLLPFMVFPIEPAEVKRAWKSVEAVLEHPVAMSHTLARVETVEGERAAYIVTEGRAAGDPTIEYSASCTFGLSRGRPLTRRAVIVHRFAQLGTRTTVVEERAQ